MSFNLSEFQQSSANVGKHRRTCGVSDNFTEAWRSLKHCRETEETSGDQREPSRTQVRGWPWTIKSNLGETVERLQITLQKLGEFERTLVLLWQPRGTVENLRDPERSRYDRRSPGGISEMFKEHLKNLEVPWQNSTLARTSANLSKAQRTATGLTEIQRIQRNPNESPTGFESGWISANVGEPCWSWAKRSKFWHTLSNLYECQRTWEALLGTSKNFEARSLETFEFFYCDVQNPSELLPQRTFCTWANLAQPEWTVENLWALENLSSPEWPSETLDLWIFIETDGTLWKIVEPCGLFWDLMEPSWTLQKRIEPYLTSQNFGDCWMVFLDLPEHFGCVLGGEALIFSILSEHVRNFVNFWRILQTIGKPSRVVKGYFVLGKALWGSWYQQSVLVLSPRSLTTSARTVQLSWTLRNMVDAFSNFVKARKVLCYFYCIPEFSEPWHNLGELVSTLQKVLNLVEVP